MREGCVSTMLAIFSVGASLFWWTGLIRLEEFVIMTFLFSVPGIICGMNSSHKEERRFAQLGCYVCFAVLLLVIMVSIFHTLNGYEWEFVRIRGIVF